jgi:TolB-like protein/Tfp pilus assembly protein PilF
MKKKRAWLSKTRQLRTGSCLPAKSVHHADNCGLLIAFAERTSKFSTMAWIQFHEFELNDQTYELRKSGVPAKIQQQPARILALLVSAEGALVSRAQIRSAIWGEETFVDFEQGLNFCIRQIRQVLNDNADRPQFLETLPRLGYRFIAPIERLRETKVQPDRSRLRIGILPIRYLEGDVEDYFTVGLTEDMISALSRLDPERLRVVAGPRLNTNEIEDAGLDRLKRELLLDYLLRISVRRSQETIRISARLHDLKENCVLWSETYDRKSSDLLAAQDEVTRQVSQSLALELLPRSESGSTKYARSAAAYDAYLKGRYFWHKTTNDAMRSSMAHFSEAIAIDPNFAPAYAGLADCYAQMGSIRVAMLKPAEALAKAKPLLQRAMDLDSTLVEAHCTLGLIKTWYELDWNGGERAFQAALSLDPNHVTALIWRSLHLTSFGRHKESIASLQRALECEPLSPVVNAYLGMARANAGQYDLGIRQLNQAIELDPHYYRAYLFLGNALCEVDRLAEAIAAFEKALSINPQNLEALAFMGSTLATAGDRAKALEILERVKEASECSEPSVLIAAIYAGLGDANEMLRYLHLAYERKSSPIYLIRFLKCFRRHQPDPRFRAFVASLGLPPANPA